MKTSKLGFAEGMLGIDAERAKARGAKFMYFDWDKAAELIKDRLKTNPELTAEAGLEGDWAYTAGVIFEDGKPNSDDYTYLCSNWATPTLIIDDYEEIECYTTDEGTRFNSDSKWDDISLKILES